MTELEKKKELEEHKERYSTEYDALKMLKSNLGENPVKKGDEMRFPKATCPKCKHRGTIYLNVKTGVCGCNTPGCGRSISAVSWAVEAGLDVPKKLRSWLGLISNRNPDADNQPPIPGLTRISDISSPDLSAKDRVITNLPSVNRILGGGLFMGQVLLRLGNILRIWQLESHLSSFP